MEVMRYRPWGLLYTKFAKITENEKKITENCIKFKKILTIHVACVVLNLAMEGVQPQVCT